MIEAAAKEIRALVALAELDRASEQRGQKVSRHTREAMANRLPQALLDRYEFLLGLGRRPAVAAIEGGACSGCHIRLPTMVESRARRAPAVHTCPQCKRMLYVPELVREDTPADEGRLRRSGPAEPTASR
jgi:hypothetical protein